MDLDTNPYEEIDRVLQRYQVDVHFWETREERPLGMRFWYELLRQQVAPRDLHEGLQALSDAFWKERILPLNDESIKRLNERVSRAVAACPQLPQQKDFEVVLDLVESQREEAERLVGSSLDRNWWVTWTTLAEIFEWPGLEMYRIALALHPCRELETDVKGLDWHQALSGLRVIKKARPDLYAPLQRDLLSDERLSSEAARRALSADPSLSIGVGDILVELGETTEGFQAYELAVGAAPNRKIQAEVGYLLLQRARVDAPPLCDDDFSDFSSVRGEEILHPKGEITSDLGPGPEFFPPSDVLRLALEAFGVAWKDGTPYGPMSWGRLVVLDGLRVALTALEDLDSADAVCNAALTLMYEEQDLLWESFQPGFLETKAYVRGRRLTTKRSRSEYQARFRSQFGFLAEHLSPETTFPLVDAEILRDQLPATAGIDWAACVMYYCKALEAELRAGVVSALERAGVPLPRERTRMTIEDVATLLENPLARGTIASLAPHLRGLFDRVPQILHSVAREFRNPAAHGGARMGPEHALKLRRSLLEGAEEGGGGVFRLLAEFSKQQFGPAQQNAHS